jgi:hypothetical protein
MTALFVGIWTVFCAVSIVTWQMITFLRDGSWHALPLSSAFNTLDYDRSEIYSTASIDKIEGNQQTALADALLQVPVIVPLLLVAALLSGFYLWLSVTEKRYLGN